MALMWGHNPTVIVHFHRARSSEETGGSRESGRRRAWGSVAAENQRPFAGPDSRSKEAPRSPVRGRGAPFVLINMVDEQPIEVCAGILLVYAFLSLFKL